MTTSENFLRAAFNSIKARIKKTIIYSTHETASFMKEAPEIIKKEWNIFKEEVFTEAERLEDTHSQEVSMKNEDIDLKAKEDIQTKNNIDKIRKKISKLNNQLEEIN